MINRLLGLLGMGAVLAGCASTSTFGLARTLNKGAVQGWVAPSGGAIMANGGGISAYPTVEGGVRFGITDRVELGTRLGFNGIAVEGKFALLRSPTMDSGFNLSLNPQVQFVGMEFPTGSLTTSTTAFLGTLSFHLPLLIGIDFFGHELVLGPRVIDQVLFGGRTSTGAPDVANLIYFGGSVGFAIRVGPGFRILPEVSLAVPAIGSAGGYTSAGFGGLFFQAGVGFLFGSAHQYDPKVERVVPAEVAPPPPFEEFTPPPPPPPAP